MQKYLSIHEKKKEIQMTSPMRFYTQIPAGNQERSLVFTNRALLRNLENLKVYLQQ